jgi:phosphoenolpyruvate-protein kinase (PTS system EI component)
MMLLRLFTPAGSKVDYKVGTMIEVPRGALRAGDLAKTAEFFSFGTNDLTQMVSSSMLAGSWLANRAAAAHGAS